MPGQLALSYLLALVALLFSAPMTQAATYEVQAGQSRIVIQVYKHGMFKILGHNHIISTRDVRGTVNWNNAKPQDTRFGLVIPVNGFRVDDPELRKQAGKGFTKDIGDDARKATRKNMLGKKVLDVLHFQNIVIRSRSIKQVDASRFDVTIELQIHGINKTVTVPVIYEQTTGAISIKGRFSLLQSEYGIKPLSVAFGAIVVEDKIDIRFLLVARKIQ